MTSRARRQQPARFPKPAVTVDPRNRYVMFMDGDAGDDAAEDARSFAAYAEQRGYITEVWRDDWDDAGWPLWFVHVKAADGRDLDLIHLEALADFCRCEGFFTTDEYEDEVLVYTLNPNPPLR